MDRKRQSKLLTILSVVFLIGLLSTVGLYFIKDKRTRDNSDFRYTIVELTDYYHQGDTRGKEIKYRLNGVIYKDHCSGDKCINAEIGTSYIIKVYLDDPEIFEILWTKRVTGIDSIPETGWKEIPI